MKLSHNPILRLLLIFVLWTLVGMFSKLPFMALYASEMDGSAMANILPVMWHGLKLDVAVAGYLTLLPGLLLIVGIWHERMSANMRGALHWICRIYSAVAAFLVALALVVNLGLYGYWGFPLDSTPLFYFLSSPADAMASITLWQAVVGIFSISVAAIVIFLLHSSLLSISRLHTARTKIVHTLTLLLLTVALIIPIRGGFTVAVNNVGSVYFSDNIRINHAAVNPVFSFLDSVAHSEDISSMYRFMDDKEAEKLFSEMTYTALRDTTDNVISSAPKHVVMVILESFSRYIMDDGGHGVKGVTPTLNTLSKEGLYFTNFYANSFRTDRGLVSILSGFPAQPTMSLMKHPRYTNNLYSIARSLHARDYATKYIYGGDANFTNMRSYLHATGFDRVVSQEDYDKSLQIGKWGVNDSVLFSRAYSEISQSTAEKPTFSVIQTSSSHEPFDVPMKHLADKRLNAFYYTDKCLGEFVAKLKQDEKWKETLLIIVPDHLGCYPENIDNFQLYRYQIPLVMVGGVVSKPQRIDTLGSQHDLAATLLGMMGIEHSEFLFSKDMLDDKAPHFAFFAVPDAMGIVTTDNAVIYDNTSNRVALKKGKDTAQNVSRAKAYLQKLYDEIVVQSVK